MQKLFLALMAGMVIAAAQTRPDYLNEGVAALKAAKYAEAAQIFENAASRWPADPTVRLYLGTVYMTQYIPGLETPENVQFATNADRQFKTVVGIQPDNAVALQSLASLHYSRGQGARSPDKLPELNEAAYWYDKVVSAHPDNREAYYSLGVIAWAKFYPELMLAREKLGMRPEDPGPLRDAAVRADLRSRLGQTVDEGMRHLERALELDPAYDDAMAYMNLLYRERADLDDTSAEYTRDIATADTWVQRALDTKRAKAQNSSPPPLGNGTSPQAEIVVVRPSRVVSGGGGGGGSFTIADPYGAPPPPPPPQSPSNGSSENRATQVRMGGNVQAAKLIEKPEADYPSLARQARIQGTVRFQVTVLKDGTVGNCTLVSGHPLLVPSATDAVRRYRYQPTLLNGEPVEVITMVDVPFLFPH